MPSRNDFVIASIATLCSAVGVGIVVGLSASPIGAASSSASRSLVRDEAGLLELAHRARGGFDRTELVDRERSSGECVDDREPLRCTRDRSARFLDRHGELDDPLALEPRTCGVALLELLDEPLLGQRRERLLQRRAQPGARNRSASSRPRSARGFGGNALVERGSPRLGQREHAARRDAAARGQRAP